MNSKFKYLYKQLMGQGVGERLKQNPPASEMEFMARTAEDNHIVVLKALMDELISHKEAPSAPSCLSIYQQHHIDFQNLLVDFHKRLADYIKIWTDRLQTKTMLPTLKQYNWIENREGRWCLAGTGSQDDAKNFYQFIAKDIVAEGVRIVALFDGALSRLQERIAREWHLQTSVDNHSKLLPLVEEALRGKEMNEFKEIRRKLPELFHKAFVREVKLDFQNSYASDVECYRRAAHVWYKPYHYDNGIEGFMHFNADFIWEFIQLKVNLFENKWRVLLRGIESSQKAQPQT